MNFFSAWPELESIDVAFLPIGATEQHGYHLFVAPSRQAYTRAGISSSISLDMHAGEGETSIVLHLANEGVIKLDQLVTTEGIVKQDHVVDVESTERTLLTVHGMKAYTKTGTIGFPSMVTVDKGEVLLEALVSEISETAKGF